MIPDFNLIYLNAKSFLYYFDPFQVSLIIRRTMKVYSFQAIQLGQSLEDLRVYLFYQCEEEFYFESFYQFTIKQSLILNLPAWALRSHLPQL